ncbi:MAG: enoyl-CoA hydratase-related protein [Desulfobacteria bacterium]
MDRGIVRLVAIAGVGTALDLTLTGREVSAEEAYRLGLVNKVVPHGELLPTAELWARMILANVQQAIRSAKETILEVIGRPLDDALRLETVNGYSSAGDVVSIRSGVLEIREKVIRFFHEMYNDETGEIAATAELTGVHLDTALRKSCPFPGQVFERAGALVVPRKEE